MKVKREINMEYASHDFHVPGQRALLLRRHEVPRRSRRDAGAQVQGGEEREVKHARLSLLWRNYRNIPFASLDAGEGDGTTAEPRVLLANHIQNAYLLTRKASLCRYLNGAADAPGGEWLRECFPKTFVAMALPGGRGSREERSASSTDDASADAGSVTTMTYQNRQVDIEATG